MPPALYYPLHSLSSYMSLSHLSKYEAQLLRHGILSIAKAAEANGIFLRDNNLFSPKRPVSVVHDPDLHGSSLNSLIANGDVFALALMLFAEFELPGKRIPLAPFSNSSFYNDGCGIYRKISAYHLGLNLSEESCDIGFM